MLAKEKICQQNPNLLLKHTPHNNVDRDCMMRHCHICYYHNLAEMCFGSKSNASTDSSVSKGESEPNFIVVFYYCHENESCHLSKMHVTLDVCDA